VPRSKSGHCGSTSTLKLGYTATQAGAALIPVTAVFLVLAPFSGALVSRFGPRWPMVAGILLVGVSQLWLAQLHPGSSYISEIGRAHV